MELVYLWINNHYNEHKNAILNESDFNFSSKFNVKYENEVLNIKYNNLDYNLFYNKNITAIVGKNGSGKSTLLQMILRYIEVPKINNNEEVFYFIKIYYCSNNNELYIMITNSDTQEKMFSGQRDNEEFIFMFRRHIISMRKGFYGLLIIFALSCIPTFIFLTYDMLLIALGGFVLGLVFFMYHFMIWYFSIYIVTDQRIRQITQKGFFSRSVIDIPLSKIQSITFSIPGLFADMFKFGTINIMTIVGDLEIKNVEHPEQIYNNLQDIVGEIETEDYED